MLAIAHRVANTLDGLARTEAGPGDVVEADIHHYRGRLEVRHLKTAGPLPVLWDRWELVPASAPRLVLEDLLRADRHGADLMLDLKGRSRSSAGAVGRSLRAAGAGPEVLVCGRYWPSVEDVARLAGVRSVLSARNRFERRALLRRVHDAATQTPYGVSVHVSLLDAAIVTELRRRVAVVMTWPVDDLATLDHVSGLRVNGVITNNPVILHEVRTRRLDPGASGLWSTPQQAVPPTPGPGGAG